MKSTSINLGLIRLLSRHSESGQPATIRYHDTHKVEVNVFDEINVGRTI